MNSWIDFKYACRLLTQKPRFTLLTITIMAVGLGLCIFTYSTIYSTALKTMPLPDGERMVTVELRENDSVEQFTQEALYQFTQQQTHFSHFGYFQYVDLNVSSSQNAKRYLGVKIRPDFFEYTSTVPTMGRAFNTEDMQKNARPVAIISKELWQNHLGGQADIIGKNITIEGNTREVVGVMPAGFLFPHNQHIWIPLQVELRDIESNWGLFPYGKLKPGASKREAETELRAIYKKVQTSEPTLSKTAKLEIVGWPISQMSVLRPMFFAMLACVFLILFLACINVANLLYARANERAKETAIRVALGAPTGRLVMQMLWESLIICGLGGVIAILLAQLGLDLTYQLLASFVSGGPFFYWQFSIDPHILSLSVVLIIITALVTGLLPAWKILSGDFNQILRDGTRGAQSRRSGKINSAIVVFEVLVACALLTASAIMSVVIYEIRHTDIGLNTKNILTAEVRLPDSLYPSDDEKQLFFNSLLANLNAQPEIDFAVGLSKLPGTGGSMTDIETQHFEKTPDNQYPNANVIQLAPGALQKLGVGLLQGRFLEDGDNASNPKVAVVTRSFFEQIMPDEKNILGQQIRFMSEPYNNAETQGADAEWFTIVGVIDHVVQNSPFQQFKHRPTVYTSINQQIILGNIALALRSHSKAPQDLIKPLQQTVHALDRSVSVRFLMSYDEALGLNTQIFGFLANVFKLFAIAALLLASAGIYGVIANAVNLRTHELGIRRALGANDKQIIRMIMKQGWLQLAIGLAAGLPLAYLISETMLAIIGGDSWLIYAMYALIPAMIASIVTLATYIPARRAVELEPSTALRYE